MRARTVEKWYGTAPLKEQWKDPRNAARRQYCERPACGAFLEREPADPRQVVDRILLNLPAMIYTGAIDHIIPERLLLKWKVKNPHDARNLICLCPKCHGRKLAADRRLCRGDMLGFLERLRVLGWDMLRVTNALRLYLPTALANRK